ncbi:uncharacterized protein C8A04DRAFT_38478 [Dichotomopilus funicola]|uniref:Archaemetzincin-2 n=1 Tax=Dichotomopilus funicola TaxID=1934379 RepID=A0AAN6V2A7_9PEZI|nr:hypothetical protein C8A04DRAFT_38478 [Dichotomopilus funicola]
MACQHQTVHIDSSPTAASEGIVPPPIARRQAATRPSGRATGNTDDHASLESLFPPPLVLPDDGLINECDEPPQTLRSWISLKERNAITRRQQTIYVVPPPTDDSVSPFFCSLMRHWARSVAEPAKIRCDPPPVETIRDYLEAFYHPLPVKLLPETPKFVHWEDNDDDDNTKKNTRPGPPQYIGLQIKNNLTRITTRDTPDQQFPRQLQLNDLLDAAIAALPRDAYAMVMLTHHDLYEDDDDDFCCGRAYGGSRVAVVSTARYTPVLDKHMGVDREHTWPLSHCEEYVRRKCWEDAAAASELPSSLLPEPTPTVLTVNATTDAKSPFANVLRSAIALPSPTPLRPRPPPNIPTDGIVTPSTYATATSDFANYWLARVVLTASHEVGHCFGFAHCVFYACAMQATGSILEDLRQPPYLCLVCEAKLGRAVRSASNLVGTGKGDGDEKEWLVRRYEKLVAFCERKGMREVRMFAAYRNWLMQRIAVVKGDSVEL